MLNNSKANFDFAFFGTVLFFVFEYSRLTAMYPILGKFQMGKVVGLLTILFCYFKDKHRKNPTSKALILWLLVCFLSIPCAINPTVAWSSFLDLSIESSMYYMLIKSIDNITKLKVFLLIFILQHLKLTIWQLRSYSYLISGEFASYHAREGVGAGSTGFMGNAGDFGVALCIIIPLTVSIWWLVRSKILKLSLLSFLCLFFISLIRTGSRASVLGLLASIGSIGLYMKKMRMITLSIIIILALSGIFWSVAPIEFKERILSAFRYDQDNTAMQRITLWKGGFKMFGDNVLLGVGIGNFPIAWQTKYRPSHYGVSEGRYAPAIVSHNNFISALAETGILGFVSYSAFIFMVFSTNLKTVRFCKKKCEEKAALRFMAILINTSMVSFLVTGMFITTIYYPHLIVIAGLSVTLYSIATRHNQKLSLRD